MSAPIRVTCPACTRRVHQQVAPDCPICAGNGVLALGPASRQYGPAVVSRAVTYALEAQAQRYLIGGGAIDYPNARRALTRTVEVLTRVGLLSGRVNHPKAAEPIDPPPPAGPANQAALAIAQWATGLEIRDSVPRLLDAPAVEYDPNAIAVDARWPGFSVAGWLCGIARITNPINPLAVRPEDPRAADRAGTMLGRAVPPT